LLDKIVRNIITCVLLSSKLGIMAFGPTYVLYERQDFIWWYLRVNDKELFRIHQVQAPSLP